MRGSVKTIWAVEAFLSYSSRTTLWVLILMRALPILLLFLTRSLLKCCALGGIRVKWGLLNPPKLLRNLELHAVIPPLLLPPITPTSTKPPNLMSAMTAACPKIFLFYLQFFWRLEKKHLVWSCFLFVCRKNEMGQAICRCQPRAASPKLRREVRETLRRPNRRIPRPAAMSRSEKQTTPFACRIFLLGLPLSLQSTSLFSAKFKYQVKKEKLGERITALQQLVSPFGKVEIHMKNLWLDANQNEHSLERKWITSTNAGKLKCGTDGYSFSSSWSDGIYQVSAGPGSGVVFSILANPAFIGPHVCKDHQLYQLPLSFILLFGLCFPLLPCLRVNAILSLLKTRKKK